MRWVIPVAHRDWASSTNSANHVLLTLYCYHYFKRRFYSFIIGAVTAYTYLQDVFFYYLRITLSNAATRGEATINIVFFAVVMLGCWVTLEITRRIFMCLWQDVCVEHKWSCPAPHISCVLLFRLSEIRLRDNLPNSDLWWFPSQSLRWADDPEALIILFVGILSKIGASHVIIDGSNLTRNGSGTRITMKPHSIGININPID